MDAIIAQSRDASGLPGDIGDDEASFLLYGQAAALSKEVPAGELVDVLVRDSREVLRQLV